VTLLIARILEPKEQSLPANGSEATFISMQRLGKHVAAATDMYATMVVRFETVFSNWSACKGVIRRQLGNRVSSLRESVWKRGSWKGAAVERGLERVKLKNLHC
jgi:hypothetical protein